MDEGMFSKSHRVHHFGSHRLACEGVQYVLSCSLLPLPLVEMAEGRVDGHSGDSTAPKQQLLC